MKTCALGEKSLRFEPKSSNQKQKNPPGGYPDLSGFSKNKTCGCGCTNISSPLCFIIENKIVTVIEKNLPIIEPKQTSAETIKFKEINLITFLQVFQKFVFIGLVYHMEVMTRRRFIGCFKWREPIRVQRFNQSRVNIFVL